MPFHDLHQCWLTVNWTLWWNLNKNTISYSLKNASEVVICKMSTILFMKQSVNPLRPSDAYMHQTSPSLVQWLVACLAPSRYQNQCGLIVNWTPGDISQWNLNQIQQFSLKKMNLKMSSAIWQPRCLDLNVLRPPWEVPLYIFFLSSSSTTQPWKPESRKRLMWQRKSK